MNGEPKYIQDTDEYKESVLKSDKELAEGSRRIIDGIILSYFGLEIVDSIECVGKVT